MEGEFSREEEWFDLNIIRESDQDFGTQVVTSLNAHVEGENNKKEKDKLREKLLRVVTKMQAQGLFPVNEEKKCLFDACGHAERAIVRRLGQIEEEKTVPLSPARRRQTGKAANCREVRSAVRGLALGASLRLQSRAMRDQYIKEGGKDLDQVKTSGGLYPSLPTVPEVKTSGGLYPSLPTAPPPYVQENHKPNVQMPVLQVTGGALDCFWENDEIGPLETSVTFENPNNPFTRPVKKEESEIAGLAAGWEALRRDRQQKLLEEEYRHGGGGKRGGNLKNKRPSHDWDPSISATSPYTSTRHHTPPAVKNRAAPHAPEQREGRRPPSFSEELLQRVSERRPYIAGPLETEAEIEEEEWEEVQTINATSRSALNKAQLPMMAPLLPTSDGALQYRPYSMSDLSCVTSALPSITEGGNGFMMELLRLMSGTIVTTGDIVSILSRSMSTADWNTVNSQLRLDSRPVNTPIDTPLATTIGRVIRNTFPTPTSHLHQLAYAVKVDETPMAYVSR